MFVSELMSRVVADMRPEGLPTIAELAEMTTSELENLLSQQIAIIKVFRRAADATLSSLRFQMESVQAEIADAKPELPPDPPPGHLPPPIAPRPPNPGLTEKQKQFRKRFGCVPFQNKVAIVRPRRPPFHFGLL
jgi:hypothetical protein